MTLFEVTLQCNITCNNLEIPYLAQITFLVSTSRGYCYIILFVTVEIKHVTGCVSVRSN